MKHTPGTWFNDCNGYAGTLITVNHPVTGHIITIASVNCGQAVGDAWKANARLITAAPELLEALQHVLEDLIHLYVGLVTIEDVCGVIPELRTVIAKATGEEQ